MYGKLRYQEGRRTRALVLLGLAIALAGCAGTSLTNMWKDSAFQGPKLQNVLVVGIGKNETARRLWEDTFSAEVGKRGVKATPLNSIYAADYPDTTVLRQKVQELGFDGIVVTHAIGREKEISYTPGYVSYGPAYGPYWGGYYGAVVSPGYITTDEYLHVETRVYATGGGGKLIWTGTTETMNPSNVEQVSHEISSVLIPELAKQGIF